MESIFGILGACTGMKKAEAKRLDDDVSEVQLNAFEFRNYRTQLEDVQQKMVERIVNQQAASLVKGKTLTVNNFASKVYMDKDLLTLEYNGEFYPLRSILKMEFFKDTEDMMGAPWVIDVTFDGVENERSLLFNFQEERSRLNFALTLRILRTRDPSLEPSEAMEVVFQEDEEEEEEKTSKTFGKIVSTQHYNIEEQGVPIIFSVTDLKLFQKLHSTSRHVYLEFFVKYPSQDKFLYAKSPTTHIPPQVLMTEDHAFKRKKEKRENDEDDKKPDKNEDVVLCAMRFELKNVKLKVPKVPHQIFGRLMAKDDYFPTAVGTFDFKVEKSMLQDKRAHIQDKDGVERSADGAAVENTVRDPVTLGIEMRSAMKILMKADATSKGPIGKEVEAIQKIGQLNIRIMGYVNDPEKKEAPEGSERKKKGKGAGGDWQGDEDDYEEDDDDDEEGDEEGEEDEEEDDA